MGGRSCGKVVVARLLVPFVDGSSLEQVLVKLVECSSLPLRRTVEDFVTENKFKVRPSGSLAASSRHRSDALFGFRDFIRKVEWL